MKKERMNRILHELINDSNRSDHQLSKTIGVSQPTVTRLRNQLEKEEYIQEYTIVPNLVKMGYSIMAIILLKYKSNGQKTKQLIEDIANGGSLFASRAQGMGKNAVLISLFKNYGEYAKYISNISNKYVDVLEKYDSILVDLKGPIIKALSFSNIA